MTMNSQSYHCVVGKLQKHSLYKMTKVKRSPKEADEGQYRWLQTTKSTKAVAVDLSSCKAFSDVTIAEHLLKGMILGFGELSSYR